MATTKAMVTTRRPTEKRQMPSKARSSSRTSSSKGEGERTKQVIVEERAAAGGTFGGRVLCRYRCGKLLGKGGFAKCYVFTECESGRRWAGKCVNKKTLKKSRAKQKLLGEITIHQATNHPHVVKFERWFEDKHNVYIILELCRNQTLMELVKRRKRLTEPEVRFYLLQIVDALQYLHKHKIIHRDLKLGNLFLNDDLHVKMGDFGLAAKLTHAGERKQTICGTPNYIAPEILRGKTVGHSYEVDIWSLGCILYTMLIGKPPFQTRNVKSTYQRIRTNTYTFPEHVRISNNAKFLIKWILTTDPSKRPTLAQIRLHPFFTQSRYVPKSLPLSSLHTPPTFAPPEAAGTATGGPLQPRAHIPNAQTPIGVALGGDAGGTQPLALAKLNLNSNNMDTRQRTGKSSGSTFAKPAPKPSSRARPAVAVDKENQHAAGGRAGRPGYSASSSQRTSSAALPPPAPTTAQTATSSTSKGDELQGMHRQLEVSLAQHGVAACSGPYTGQDGATAATTTATTTTGSAATAAGPEQMSVHGVVAGAWVTKWVDYTSKYGLGYLMSNGSVGVYFNDSSKIILSSDGEHFEYIERSRRLPCGKRTTPARQHHTLSVYAESLKKKVTLLKHFRNHLLQQQQPLSACSREEKLARMAGSGAANMTFVKKWVSTRHAVLFRISNRTVQVCFFDKSEVILSAEGRQVTFLDKAGVRQRFSLENVMSTRPDVARRLKYTKDILHKMITGGKR